LKTLLAVLLLVIAGCSPQATEPQTGTIPDLDKTYEFDSLTVINDAGEPLHFDVYVARSWQQQRQGLMFVRRMPATTGMLFVYPGEDIRSMWMKNTYIPLDMVFARADGSVINVITDTVPQTLLSNKSTQPARYVLELNAGTTRRLGIGTRSRLIWEDNVE
jgi:uncharacterized membrane protein (UPF0127 family)